jgi:hypothetical protein
MQGAGLNGGSASLAELSRGLGSEDEKLGERATDHAPAEKSGPIEKGPFLGIVSELDLN